MSFVSFFWGGFLQLLISLESIDQFQWGFLQNVALTMVHTIRKMKTKFDFRLTLLDHMEVNNRLTGWAFAHPVKLISPPSKFNLPIAQNCPPSKLSCPQKNGHHNY